MIHEEYKTVTISEGDSLWKIANKNKVSVQDVLAANPEINDPKALRIGQKVKVPSDKVSYTIRFVNLFDQPPAGIQYKVMGSGKVIATGKVTKAANEAHVLARNAEKLSILVRKMGESQFQKIAEISVDRRRPLALLKINSAKIPSKTSLHPKTGAKPASLPNKSLPASSPEKNKKEDQGLPNEYGHNQQSHPEHTLMPGDCSCGKDITIDELAAIFPSRKRSELDKFLSPINAMLRKYGIQSCLRKSHALAQIGHESGYLRYVAEVLPTGTKEDDVYDGYKGRGLIQITFKKNYERYGEYVGVNFLGENKEKLESIEWATDSAGWYWCHGTSSNLNAPADRNDLLDISVSINGGFNGFNDREAIFKRAHKILRAPLCRIKENNSNVPLPFAKSAAYEKRDAAFAYGYWSDPTSTQKGLSKDLTNSKLGYTRFLELNEKNPIKKRRFGFKSTDAMIKHAKEKSQ